VNKLLQNLPAVVVFASVVSLTSIGLHRIAILENTVDKLSAEVEKQTMAINHLSTTMATHLAMDGQKVKGGSLMPPRQ
jgi:nickel-dependent lactate racemase